MEIEVSAIVGEFSLINRQIVQGSKHRPILKEKIYERTNLAFNLTEGYDENKHYEACVGIGELYEYVCNSNILQNGSSNVTNMENVNIVCGRYVLTAINDAHWYRNDFELMAIRKNNVIYIGLNRLKALQQKMEIKPEQYSINLYCGLNFAIFMADNNLLDDIDSPNFENSHSIVRKVRFMNRTKGKEISVYVSSTVRAFEEDEPVELHTIGYKRFPEKQLRANTTRAWWLRAVLSGAPSVVYGIKNNFVVGKVNKIETERLVNEYWRVDEHAGTEFIHEILAGIVYHLKSNDDCCSVQLVKNYVKIENVDYTFMDRSPYW